MFNGCIGALVIFLTLLDAFEATVLPRRVTRRLRPARLFFRGTWAVWQLIADRLPGRHRENALAAFGPLSLLGLFASWTGMLIFGFGLIHGGIASLGEETDPRQYLYMSGETFFTLGYGDITPKSYFGKLFAVIEAGTGFGFMAIIIGYLPVLYQAFSRREQTISLLDGRAGSPPTAAEFVRRLGGECDETEMARILTEWELWSADLLESHLSFPVLSFYRSQHANQSWLSALAVILDVSAYLTIAGNAKQRRRAELTFAMARHASVDLCLVFSLPPAEVAQARLTDDEARRLLTLFPEDEAPTADELRRLQELVALYEPFLHALAAYFHHRLTRFFADQPVVDNWQTSPWMKRAPRLLELSRGTEAEESHFG